MSVQQSTGIGKIKVTIALVFASILSITNCGVVHFQDCGSTANVTQMRVTGCTNPPCIFLKGKPYEIEIDAISNCHSKKLPYKVTAKLLFPFTILKGDACQVLSRGSCPVVPGAEFTYRNTINISSSYPAFHTKVTALVQDDAGEKVICIILDVSIKKKYTDRHQWIFF